ncbi:MAG: VWA domain-containing protein [Acidobacteria bacterium]|nr:VWA domain-containing protein [Acidobacteriota bacterium]
MRFLRPDMSGWLLAIPILLACWFMHAYYKRAIRRVSALVPGLSARSRMSTWRSDVVLLVLWALAAAALVIAVMRPQMLLRMPDPQLERQDLVLVLDRSASMHAQDVTPSRFLRAIAEMKTFLRHKPDAIERVGLVGFADSSVVLSHLTRDVDSLLFYLDWISEDAEPLYGTDMGAALATALDVARKDTSRNAKVYVILSDGEDHGAALTVQLDAMRLDGTRVYVIGIGSYGEAAIPFVQPDGTQVFLRDDDGKMLMTRFNESTLRRIADVTGARYYRSVTGAELSAAMNDIVRHEQKILGWKMDTQYRDLYRVGLAVAGVAVATLLLML